MSALPPPTLPRKGRKGGGSRPRPRQALVFSTDATRVVEMGEHVVVAEQCHTVPSPLRGRDREGCTTLGLKSLRRELELRRRFSRRYSHADVGDRPTGK